MEIKSVHSKEEFIKRANFQIEVLYALIYASSLFEEYVQKFDGKVYNIRLFDSFNADPRVKMLGGHEGFHFEAKALKDKEHTPTNLYVSAVFDYRAPDMPGYSGLNDYRHDMYFGYALQTQGEKYASPDRYFVKEGRISYSAFHKLRQEELQDFFSEIADLKNAIEHIDEYMELCEEVSRMMADTYQMFPNCLQPKLPFSKYHDKKLFA